MAPKKIKCNFKDCRDAAQRIVGDCAFCNQRFCGRHRLLEDHKCSGLEDVSIPDTPWWLVGLAGELSGDEDLFHEADMLTGYIDKHSARRRPTSRTRPSCRPSAPTSSRVSNRDDPRLHRRLRKQQQRRHRQRRRRCRSRRDTRPATATATPTRQTEDDAPTARATQWPMTTSCTSEMPQAIAV